MWFRNRAKTTLLLAGALAASMAIIGSQLDPSSQNVVGGSVFEGALYREMPLPGGVVLARRAPAEASDELTRLLKTSQDPTLFALRAQERERLLAIDGAEQDWKQAVTVSPSKEQPLRDLANFYDRRNEPRAELATLLQLAQLPASGLDRYRAPEHQPAWQAFERAAQLTTAARLEASEVDPLYQGWIERYPKSTKPYTLYLDHLASIQNASGAQALVHRIASSFPSDVQLQVESEAQAAGIAGGQSAQLAAYDSRFDPLWPQALRTHYFELLRASGRLRPFLAQARSTAANEPNALAPVLKIFFYYEGSGDRANADRTLLEWQSRHDQTQSPLSASNYNLVATLYERIGDYDESARASYLLYEEKQASADQRESALAHLISLLLDVPEQPLQLGERDLSLYQNAAQMDRHPGFLNGILSLALNTTYPQYAYQSASQTAVAYFHRASAAQWIERMKSEFPASKRTPALEAKLFSAYAVYGQNDALLRFVPDWLKSNTASADYVNAALLLGDAYRAVGRSQDEFRLYDELLETLAARSDHVPIGTESAKNARSPEYTRVLDRYLSRLTALKRLPQALALYKGEIVRNPDDPGLYERLALFVEQNRMDAQLEATYREAFTHFQQTSWADKLARLYLRRRQYANYQELVRQIGDSFQGSQLALFVTHVAPNTAVSPALYRQINLYAHQRFPHNLVFVRNLLRAYQLKATADPAAYAQLLRENWFYDASLRTSFFELLTRTGKLQQELAALPNTQTAARDKNMAALEMQAEGLAWRTQFEESAVPFAELAELSPGDRGSNARAISIERSLAATQDAAFATAVRFAEQDTKAAPSVRETFTKVGEMYADRDLYRDAKPWWDRIPAIRPGVRDGYLDAATVFWDYFRYTDALQEIARARQVFKEPALFAYEAGAIYENENDYNQAATEYVQAALEQPQTGQNSLAEQRLITLAERPATAVLVEQRTAQLVGPAFDSRALALRLRILENAGRLDQIHALLNQQIPRATAVADAESIRASADHFGFDDTSIAALQRVIELTADPVEKMKAEVDLAAFYESHQDPTSAARELNALLNRNPAVIGVIRANVDFYWREKQSAKAIGVLTSSAARAQPPYNDQLLSEAAAKANDSGDYQTARTLLDKLLAKDPFNGDLLARKAETYARANDIQALASFYGDELKSVSSSSLSAAEKSDTTAALRRGYIPALIKTRQTSVALDQYEQLLNQFSEDAGLAREAAQFAAANHLADALTAYYRKAVTDSPRNYRWPLLLARIDRALGLYEDALPNYQKAAYVRPDRLDILQAKADLELRLEKFDDALKTNDKLYDLSYHSPQYLVAKASIFAAQDRTADALQALRSGDIERQPKETFGYVDAMRQLLAWSMFEQADAIYHELRPLLPDHPDAAAEAVTLELQALSSAHRFNDAIDELEWALRNVKDVAPNGDFSRYAEAIGKGIRDYATPEEKQTIATVLAKPGALPSGMPVSDLANAAGLFDTAAESLAKNPSRWQTLQQLQTSRLEFSALGRSLESFSHRTNEAGKRDVYLNAALESYTRAGDATAALRTTSALMADGSAVDPENFARLFLRTNGRLSTLLPARAKYADAVVQRLFELSGYDEVLKALTLRGAPLNSTWVDSYSGLAGLYFARFESPAAGAFDRVLGARTVGAELTQIKSGSNLVLNGATWLYYAGRYGEYLGRSGAPAAGELLPAPLENAPAASDSYVQLAQTFSEMQQPAKASEQFQDALQLSPERPSLHDGLAQTEFAAGHNDQASKDWQEALRLVLSSIHSAPAAGRAGPDAQTILTHAGRAGLAPAMQPLSVQLIRTIVRFSNGYDAVPVISAVIQNAPQQLPPMLQLGAQIDLVPAINQLVAEAWPTGAQKTQMYQFLVERARQSVERSAGDARNAAQDQLYELLSNYARFLLAQGQPEEAWTVLSEMEAQRRPVDLLLQSAALSGHLSQLLQKWQLDASSAPSGDQILNIAADLKSQNHADVALPLREYEYTRELQSPDAPASAYFGQADVLLEQRRVPEAQGLIRGALMNAGMPFENLPEAVHLLERHGKPKEALVYAEQWRAANPWSAEAQLAYARLADDAAQLEAVRSSTKSPYRERTEAAQALAKLHRAMSGTDELALLTHALISPAETSQPFYVAARVRAAGEASDIAAKSKLLRAAIASDPSLNSLRPQIARLAFALHQTSFGVAVLDTNANAGVAGDLAGVQAIAARELVNDHEPGRAIAMYDAALSGTKDPAAKAALTQQRQLAIDDQHLQLLNSERQPVIHDELSQTVIVRPRWKTLPPGGDQ